MSENDEILLEPKVGRFFLIFIISVMVIVTSAYTFEKQSNSLFRIILSFAIFFIFVIFTILATIGCILGTIKIIKSKKLGKDFN